MNLAQTMAALERAGSEQTRKTYRRHGAQDPMFGVSYAALYGLQKQTGTDQALAEALWETGNHDARVLAMLIADGEQMTAAKLNRWRRTTNQRFLSMSFTSLAARSKAGLECALQWIDGKDEYEQAAGWGTLAGLASSRAVADAVFAPLLPRLEVVVHELPNMARYYANNCLIAIGGRPELTAAAMAVARKVGRVEVDHGDTDCKTPVATEYIVKMASRNAAKAAKAAKKAPGKPAKKAVAKPAKKTKAKAKARR